MGERERMVETKQEEEQRCCRERKSRGHRVWVEGEEDGRGRGRENMEEKIKRGQEHRDRERTNHLDRGGGRIHLCGVRDEKAGKNRKLK